MVIGEGRYTATHRLHVCDRQRQRLWWMDKDIKTLASKTTDYRAASTPKAIHQSIKVL